MGLQVDTVLPGGCSKGALTHMGQQQARDLGAWLRHRYTSQFDLLEPVYQVCYFDIRTSEAPAHCTDLLLCEEVLSRHNRVFGCPAQAGTLGARTTAFERTKDTLRGVLTGLYPELASSTIPVTTSSDEEEILYGNTTKCRQLGALMKTAIAQQKGLPLAVALRILDHRAHMANGLS